MHSDHLTGRHPAAGQPAPEPSPIPYAGATDLIVTTANPQALDATVQQLGAAVVVDGSWDGETCRVRVFGDASYIRFAITNQGYGRIVGQEPVPQGSADAAN